MRPQGGPHARATETVIDAVRPRWRLLALVTAGYVLVYLVAIQNLVVSWGTDLRRFVPVPSIQVAPQWPSKVLDQIGPFYYEPIAAIYPVNHVTLFLSPVNLFMGLLLGALVAVNVALALHVYRLSKTCRLRGFTGVLGALPGFLTGFACCVPSLALALGAPFTAAVVALRSYLFPLALAILAAAVGWNVRRARKVATALPIPAPLTGTAPASGEPMPAGVKGDARS